MDWFPVIIGPAITLILSFACFYAAFNKLVGQFEDLKEQITKMQSNVAEVKNTTNSLATDIARLDERFSRMSKDVEKYNHVIERTYKLETDVKTYQVRYDDAIERLERLENIKIGGTL